MKVTASINTKVHVTRDLAPITLPHSRVEPTQYLTAPGQHRLVYVPSCATDVRATMERARKALQATRG